MSLLLQLAREFIRRSYVLGLIGSVAPGQKNHDCHAAQSAIHPKAWTMVNSHFRHAFSNSLVFIDVDFFGAINASQNSSGRLSVLQGLKPHIKDFGGVDRLCG